MASTDIDPVVARMVNVISALPEIGLAYPEDLWDRKDLRPLTVSNIAGRETLRAWFVSGPSMTSERAVASSTQHLRRSWTYTIYGIEGLRESSQATLRSNALRVTDALDADRTLGGTCHDTMPSTWRLLQNRAGWRGIAVSWVEITKTVRTLSNP